MGRLSRFSEVNQRREGLQRVTEGLLRCVLEVLHRAETIGGSVRNHTARRRAIETAKALGISMPFDLDEFCRQVETQRGRPLKLRSLPADALGDFCGLYVETQDADLIFYPTSSSPMHQAHVIVHELMHLILGHGERGPDRRLAVDAASLLPDIDPALLRRALGRSGYLSEQEEEAELTASIIIHGWPEPRTVTPVERLDWLLD